LAGLPVFGARKLGYLFTRLQNGALRTRGAVMAAGFVLVASWYLLPHARLEAPNPDQFVAANPILLAAAQGFDYQYRWILTRMANTIRTGKPNLSSAINIQTSDLNPDRS